MKYENTSNYSVKTEHTVTNTNNKTYFYNFDIEDTYHIEENQVTVYINQQPVSDFTVDKTNNNITFGDSITLVIGDKIKILRNTNISNRVVNYYNISSFTPNELNYSFKQIIRKGQENEFRITEAEQGILDNRELIEENSDRIDQLEEDVLNLGDINAFIDRLEIAETDIDNLEIDVNDLYNQVGDNDLDIADLYNITDALDLRITDLEDKELPIATYNEYGVVQLATYGNVESYKNILDDQQDVNYNNVPIIAPALLTQQTQIDFYNDFKDKALTLNTAMSIPHYACEMTEIADPTSPNHWYSPTYTKGGLAKKYEWVDKATFDNDNDDHRYMTPNATKQAINESLGSGEVLGQILDIPVVKAQNRTTELIEANGSKYVPTDPQMTELKNIYDTSANVVSVDPVQYNDFFDGGLTDSGGHSSSDISKSHVIRKKDNSDGYIMIQGLIDPDTGYWYYRVYETNSNTDLSNWVLINEVGRNISNSLTDKIVPTTFNNADTKQYFINDQYFVLNTSNTRFYVIDFINDTFKQVRLKNDLLGQGDPQEGALISGYYVSSAYFINGGFLQYKHSNTEIDTYAVCQFININDYGDKFYASGFLRYNVLTDECSFSRITYLEQAPFDTSIMRIQGENIAFDYQSYNVGGEFGYLINIDDNSGYLKNYSPLEGKFFFFDYQSTVYDFDSNGNIIDDPDNKQYIRLLSINKTTGELKYEFTTSLDELEEKYGVSYTSSDLILNTVIDSDTGAFISALNTYSSSSDPIIWILRSNTESEFFIREYNPIDYGLGAEFSPQGLNTQFIEKGIGFHSSSDTRTNFTNNINDFINGDLLYSDKEINIESNTNDQDVNFDPSYLFTDFQNGQIQYSKENRVIIYPYYYRSGDTTATFEYHTGLALCGYDIADYIQVPDLRDRFDKTGKFKSYVVKSETGGITGTDLGKDNNEY